MSNNYRYPLEHPADVKLPFFAYGIFKPGQLAYSKIRNHVYEKKNAEIPYMMMHRDGVPILIDRESKQDYTQGVIMRFKEGQEEETYHVISITLSKKLYEWKTIEIDGIKVNVVFGVNPDYGSDYIEDPYERVCFDGKYDPLFKEALELIESNLKSNRNSMNPKNIFNLQMNYMLLWSAIDRFSSLKFNLIDQTDNLKKFANQKTFKEGIKKFQDKRHRPVYSTDKLEIHKFNAEDSEETLFYYYTLRCNVVHRGKAAANDYLMLETATEELLELFRDILEQSFDDT